MGVKWRGEFEECLVSGLGRRTYLLPVLATVSSTYCCFAVTSQATNEQIRPRIGDAVTAARF